MSHMPDYYLDTLDKVYVHVVILQKSMPRPCDPSGGWHWEPPLRK